MSKRQVMVNCRTLCKSCESVVSETKLKIPMKEWLGLEREDPDHHWHEILAGGPVYYRLSYSGGCRFC